MVDNKIKAPELLSPAGNFEKLRAALLYGADAVYCAGRSFGMRSAADNFTNEELAEAVKYTHERGKKIYLTLNTMPHGDEYDELRAFLTDIKDIGIDAFIIADLGVMATVKQIIPNAEIHVSTQASIVSPEAALAYVAMGATRLVLARELTFKEIRKIKDALPEGIELEAFVHGSMCVSFSGRCLLSNNLVGRDANRGACAQPCRWNYTIREEKRPEMEFPIGEEREGTYIMSSKDMCMVEHMNELIEAGITSFKIEGRMKSAYYTAVVTNAYRAAIDGYMAKGNEFSLDPAWLLELDSVSHREYCTGYFFDDPMNNAQTCTVQGYLREKAYLAVVTEYDAEKGMAKCIQRNKFCAHDAVELITPGETGKRFEADEMYNLEGEAIPSVPHPFMEFYLKVPFPVKSGDILRGANR